MRYVLEHKEPYIVKTELLKNRTHQSWRWKGIAVSEDLKSLKKYKEKNRLDSDNYRIIDSNLNLVG